MEAVRLGLAERHKDMTVRDATTRTPEELLGTRTYRPRRGHRPYLYRLTCEGRAIADHLLAMIDLIEVAEIRPTILRDLSRPVILQVCPDGTVTFRRRGQPVFNGRALPFFSVADETEAKDLQALLCALQDEKHPQLPGQPWYRRYQFSLGVDGITKLRAEFRDAYERLQHSSDGHSE